MPVRTAAAAGGMVLLQLLFCVMDLQQYMGSGGNIILWPPAQNDFEHLNCV